MNHRHLTTAEALVEMLKSQYIQRDGAEPVRFFAGVLGSFNPDPASAIYQAFTQSQDFSRLTTNSPRAAVDFACGYARAAHRLRTFVCLGPAGPGATDMAVSAALTDHSHLPVLVLAEDMAMDESLRPVSRMWERIVRPEQMRAAFAEAMRVLTSPTDVGMAVLSLPVDLQKETWDFPESTFAPHLWTLRRQPADRSLLQRAVRLVRAARRPVIAAGGEVFYSLAGPALDGFARRTCIPVVETLSGTGALPPGHPLFQSGHKVENSADLVIAVGVLGDELARITSAAQVLRISASERDAYRGADLALVCDVRLGLEELGAGLGGFQLNSDTPSSSRTTVVENQSFAAIQNALQKGDAIVAGGETARRLQQTQVLSKSVNWFLDGYAQESREVAGGMGVKSARPEGEVIVVVNEAGFLEATAEIAQSIQAALKLTIVVEKETSGIELAAAAVGLGAAAFPSESEDQLRDALLKARTCERTVVVFHRKLNV